MWWWVSQLISWFVYQLTIDILELKNNKGTGYVLGWESKRLFNSKLSLLHTTFLYSIKLSWYKMGIKSAKDILAV